MLQDIIKVGTWEYEIPLNTGGVCNVEIGLLMSTHILLKLHLDAPINVSLFFESRQVILQFLAACAEKKPIPQNLLHGLGDDVSWHSIAPKVDYRLLWDVIRDNAMFLLLPEHSSNK